MNGDPRPAPMASEETATAGEIGLLDLVLLLIENVKLLIGGALLAGLLALGITYLITPTFTARTTFLPPQQQQSAASSALASLGALSGLAGTIANVKSPAEQYVALMRSVTVADRLIDRFDLMSVYEAKYRVDARETLAANVHISVGKKDGLITVDVDDSDPRRAADLANHHVEELRGLTDRLALSEAQQRRAFFEVQLQQTKDRLAKAQRALQASGFNEGALKAEPKAAAEEYARLKAEVTSAQVRVQTLRRSLAEDTPEIQQQRTTLAALNAQLARAEAATVRSGDGGPDSDYVGKYREFKYQETLFELFAKQYELARLDESQDGALIQVVDQAAPPEKKSRPKRAVTALITTMAAMLVLALFVVTRHFWRGPAKDSEMPEKVGQERTAVGRR